MSKLSRAIHRWRRNDRAVARNVARAAAEHEVSGEIHPEDFIYRHMLHHPTRFRSARDATDFYFGAGKRAVRDIHNVLRSFTDRAPLTVLEFASGYGAMTRHMAAGFPGAEVTACDIHATAVEFIRDRLGTPAILSSHRPQDFDTGRQFDALVAISFFSHMPDRTWQPWLAALARQLVPGGLLLFTTHGRVSRAGFGAVELQDGYFFRPDSEQGDLDAEEYGSTVTLFDYVYRQIRTTGGLDLVLFQEGFWGGDGKAGAAPGARPIPDIGRQHQDLYLLQKRD